MVCEVVKKRSGRDAILFYSLVLTNGEMLFVIPLAQMFIEGIRPVGLPVEYNSSIFTRHGINYSTGRIGRNFTFLRCDLSNDPTPLVLGNCQSNPSEVTC